VNTWEQELWDLLCALYRMYQGDCKDLPPRPKANELVAFMWGVFSVLGPPNVSDPADKARLLKILNDIDSHLKDPDNDLDPATNQSLVDLVAAIRNAVKP
jgi:hypothetical protein